MDWGLRTADCGLRTADCGLRTADCGLRTADCGLRTADCGLRTADCGLRTADCGTGLNLKCGPSLKIAVVTDKYKNMLPFQFQDQILLPRPFKDGAPFCYCAYVLCISGYSGLLRNLPTNTTILLRGLRLRGKSRS